jgi:adenosylcobyric acid synthase
MTARMIMVQGSASSVVEFLRQSGLAGGIIALSRAGTPVLGICGGFQILGETILDPERVESDREVVAGLALLPVQTTFRRDKTTIGVTVTPVFGPGLVGALNAALPEPFAGYEIHHGETIGDVAPAFRVCRHGTKPVSIVDGSRSSDGLIVGTYIHGVLVNEWPRRALLSWLRRRRGLSEPDVTSFAADPYDAWADLLEGSIDVARLFEIAGVSLPESTETAERVWNVCG